MKDRQFEELQSIVSDCWLEHKMQVAKWGVQDITSFEWITFLTEEVSELSEAISEYEYRDGISQAMYREAIQVATLALKIAEMSKLLPELKQKSPKEAHGNKIS
mgnify:CR=1 FL=1